MFSSKVELFKEPSKIVEKLSGSYKSEMTEWQLGFLCGLIKEYQPKKILEIGVAAGGTTAVIVVSDDKEISEQDESTIHISDLTGIQMDCTIIAGSIIYQQEICRILKEKGYKNIVLLNKGISVFLERER